MRKQLQELAEVYYGKSPSEVIDDDSQVPIVGTGGIYGTAKKAMFPGPAIVVPRKGSLSNPQILEEPFWPVDTTYAVVPRSGIDARWLYYNLDRYDLTKLNEATGVPSINREWLRKITFLDPGGAAQKQIGRILSVIDRSIDQTEALIAKYRYIKAGLMQDLFTRGVDGNGQLRPPHADAPKLYQESVLGWIPKEWSCAALDEVAESLIDGPFGSNLKSEHYVAEPGVRVARLQNIDADLYDDGDRAFISEHHARRLLKHAVVSGDILIAALGEDRHPVGRACLYPDGLGPCINKADCFRLRCWPERARNRYTMLFLNSWLAQRQIGRFVQGVTRRRINTGNLRKLLVAVPKVEEQDAIGLRVEYTSALIGESMKMAEKFRQQKQGLMYDLLTGQKQVRVDGPKEEVASV